MESELLVDVFVGSLMSSPVVTLEMDESMNRAARRMLDHDINSLVVTDGDSPEGIVTTTDVLERVAENDVEATGRTAMSDDLTCIDGDATLDEASQAMLDANVHHLPVTDGDDRVIGIVTTTDVTQYMATLDLPA